MSLETTVTLPGSSSSRMSCTARRILTSVARSVQWPAVKTQEEEMSVPPQNWSVLDREKSERQASNSFLYLNMRATIQGYMLGCVSSPPVILSEGAWSLIPHSDPRLMFPGLYREKSSAAGGRLEVISFSIR